MGIICAYSLVNTSKSRVWGSGFRIWGSGFGFDSGSEVFSVAIPYSNVETA